MELLQVGSKGPSVELLQSILNKIGYFNGVIDGIFGQQTKDAITYFQNNFGLVSDGIVGNNTWKALKPYRDGNTNYTVKSGDTLYQIARYFSTTIDRIITANPGINANNLQIGQKLIIPFGTIIPTDISYTYDILQMNLDALKTIYPFIETGSAGQSVLNHSLYYVRLGRGQKEVFYNASFHANEWITTSVLMKFIENFSKAYAENKTIYGYRAREIFDNVSIYLIPMVNPDGVDLVTGNIKNDNPAYIEAKKIAENYSFLSFPSSWKANIRGVDLNLQYPANWEIAKELKYQQGYVSPAPRDFVGYSPRSEPEANAVYLFTQSHDFRLILAYHTQGSIIYWQYLDYEPPYSYEIGTRLSDASGYRLGSTPYYSSFAGFKDWFIQDYDRPGYTVEVGSGINPLPISQFSSIYNENEGILVLGAVLSV
ncbi:MAG: peptidoglycan-binding protein [Lachnoclostridium sp.]|jgi:g-D-glutamyl-meso-diaminopimelate peptidase|nr:peptidoglycan-binding protein [Lachnoclostridium sp.]